MTKTLPPDGYLYLRVIAEVYEDIQSMRVGIENRMRTAPVDVGLLAAATGVAEKVAGEPRRGVAESENQIKLLLARTYRQVVSPEVRAWQQEHDGIGEHLLARLLGAIGHPVHTAVHEWRDNSARTKVDGKVPSRVLVVSHEMERRVSDLWSYCGHGDPTRKAHKGMTAAEAAALGNPRAKMLTHLLAEATVKEGGRDVKLLFAGEQHPVECKRLYRRVYEEARLRYVTRLHAAPCVRCGPSGTPAAEGSPWSDAHQHAAALRLAGKEILRDLWKAAQ